jgi:hypothetical protein
MRIKTSFTTALRLTALTVAIAALTTGSVFAQSGSRNAVSTGSTSSSGFGGTGNGGGGIASDGTITGGGSGASTPAESRLRGVAELVRATGQSQNNASRAAINLRTAEGKAIQNRIAAARAKVEIRQARIDAERLKATYQQEIRKLRSERLALLRTRPKRVAATLTAREFDKYTGEVQWPMAITHPIFAKQRTAVEQALKSKTRMQKHADEKLTIAVDALRKAIGRNAQTLGYKKFASANNFTKRLQNQIRFQEEIKRVEMLASM